MQTGSSPVLSTIFVHEAETFGRRVHLVRRDGELAADGAPDLTSLFRAVERRLRWRPRRIDAGWNKNVAHHAMVLQCRPFHVFLARILPGALVLKRI